MTHCKPSWSGTKFNHLATGTGNDEWYTPAKFIEAARIVLGEIDLDPASCEFAQRTVQAKNYFTKKDDALAQEWHGRIWMNPPYSRKLISQFVDKLMNELSAGRATEAIVLTYNTFDTKWGQKLAGLSDTYVFTRGRVRFVNAEGKRASPTRGSAFVYLGPNPDRFVSVFSYAAYCAGEGPRARVPVRAFRQGDTRRRAAEEYGITMPWWDNDIAARHRADVISGAIGEAIRRGKKAA